MFLVSKAPRESKNKMKLYLHDIRIHNYSTANSGPDGFPDKSAVQIFAADESGSKLAKKIEKDKIVRQTYVIFAASRI